jgi:hypothetical protein
MNTQNAEYLEAAGYNVPEALQLIETLEAMSYTPEVNTLGIILRKESGTVFHGEAQGLLAEFNLEGRYTTRYKSSYAASLLLPIAA